MEFWKENLDFLFDTPWRTARMFQSAYERTRIGGYNQTRNIPIVGPVFANQAKGKARNDWWNAYDKRYGVRSNNQARDNNMYGGGIGYGYSWIHPQIPDLYEWW